jgi:hypothetical protein
MAHKTPQERFFAKVRTDGADGCHDWIGSKNVWGYGRLHWGGKMLSAHRVAWEMANGPIPPGLHVLHHCDNRACVTPAHLFLGTHADNMLDMLRKGRARRGQPRPEIQAERAARRVARRVAETAARLERLAARAKEHVRTTRLEFLIPVDRRIALEGLAAEVGVPAAVLARVGIELVLRQRGSLTLQPPTEAPHA